MMTTEAVILMAGAGSRLGEAAGAIVKPLVQVGGRPLISHTLDALASAGVRRVHAVMGAASIRLTNEIEHLLPAGMQLNALVNPEWQRQNGVSVLCAARHAKAPFFLAMGDHLFDPEIFPRLLRETKPEQLNLAIDRKISAIFDLDDAMKVQTRNGSVTRIAKDLVEYDAIDTGLFLCPNELFDYLQRALRDGDCSLAQGVRLMAADGKVRAVDIGDAWWQDVDTPAMHAHAEAHFAAAPLAQTAR